MITPLVVVTLSVRSNSVSGATFEQSGAAAQGQRVDEERVAVDQAGRRAGLAGADDERAQRQ
jgi:hypothetical protein